MRRRLRELRPDVVHAHWMPFAVLAALAGARPLVATAWGSDVYGAGLRQRLLIRLALRRTAVATADSMHLLERVLELGPRSLPTMVVNWGVDLDAVGLTQAHEREEAKTRFGLGTGPVVFSPRGLKELYNPDMVVDAFARIRAALPGAVLVLKHSGTEELLEPGWLELPGVHVVGRIDDNAMAALYRAADVTVSIPDSDSSPRSVWEAMAAGSATVLSDLPWVHELIADERDALVVSAEAGTVAAAIERLLLDDALRKRITISARHLVERHRNRTHELDRLEACYRELADAR
jgi:glycosyltransferase involved in cell wall biosynthesis